MDIRKDSPWKLRYSIKLKSIALYVTVNEIRFAFYKEISKPLR